MYMLILNFTYPLRCLRVPPVEYHCFSVLWATNFMSRCQSVAVEMKHLVLHIFLGNKFSENFISVMDCGITLIVEPYRIC